MKLGSLLVLFGVVGCFLALFWGLGAVNLDLNPL